MSFPPYPQITSLPPVPVSVSFPAVPRMVQFGGIHSVTVIVAVAGAEVSLPFLAT